MPDITGGNAKKNVHTIIEAWKERLSNEEEIVKLTAEIQAVVNQIVELARTEGAASSKLTNLVVELGKLFRKRDEAYQFARLAEKKFRDGLIPLKDWITEMEKQFDSFTQIPPVPAKDKEEIPEKPMKPGGK